MKMAFFFREERKEKNGPKKEREHSGGWNRDSLLRNAAEGARMEFRGNREVVLEDCRGILEYDTDVIRVRVGKRVVRFTGRGLSIRCMTADSMVVEGFLTGMEFLR